MTTDQLTIQAFIAREGLTMTVAAATSNPNMFDPPSPGACFWTCTITSKARGSLIVPFSCGAAYRVWNSGFRARVDRDQLPFIYTEGAKPGARVRPPYFRMPKDYWKIIEPLTSPIPPDLATVLDCLASDSSSYDNARDFDDWANDFGLDTDSRKAEATYRVCGEQAKRLRHLLGDEAYRELLERVERL